MQPICWCHFDEHQNLVIVPSVHSSQLSRCHSTTISPIHPMDFGVDNWNNFSLLQLMLRYWLPFQRSWRWGVENYAFVNTKADVVWIASFQHKSSQVCSCHNLNPLKLQRFLHEMIQIDSHCLCAFEEQLRSKLQPKTSNEFLIWRILALCESTGVVNLLFVQCFEDKSSHFSKKLLKWPPNQWNLLENFAVNSFEIYQQSQKLFPFIWLGLKAGAFVELKWMESSLFFFKISQAKWESCEITREIWQRWRMRRPFAIGIGFVRASFARWPQQHLLDWTFVQHKLCTKLFHGIKSENESQEHNDVSEVATKWQTNECTWHATSFMFIRLSISLQPNACRLSV